MKQLRIKIQDINTGDYQELVFTPKSIYFWDNTTFKVEFTPTERVKLDLAGAIFDHEQFPTNDGVMCEWFQWSWPSKPYYNHSQDPRATPKFSIQFWPSLDQHPTVFFSYHAHGRFCYPSVDMMTDEYTNVFLPFMAQVKEFYSPK